MQHASVTLHSPEHKVLKQVLVSQRINGGLLAVSFERVGDALVGTHTEIDSTDARRVLGRMTLVADEFSAS